MALEPQVAEAHFQRALSEEIGFCIECDDPKALRQDLYLYRMAFKGLRPELDRVIMFLPPVEGKTVLYLVKKDVEL